MGAQHLATEEDQAVVQNGNPIFRFRIVVINVTGAVFRSLCEVGAQILLLLFQDLADASDETSLSRSRGSTSSP